MRATRRFGLTAAAVLLALGTACGGGDGAGDQSGENAATEDTATDTEGGETDAATEASGEPITVGFLVPQTTANALLGESLITGVEMAVDEINSSGGIDGRPINLEMGDIGDNNTQAVNALQQVAAEDPVAIIGHAWSTMQVAQNDLIRETGVPFFYSGSSVNLGQDKMENDWLFRITANDNVMASAAAKYIVDDLGVEKIGILYSNEEFGIAGRDVITEGLAQRGIEPVAVEAHESAAQDLSAQLLNLQRAGAELIVGWSFPVPTALALRQMNELQIDIPYLGGRSMALAAVLDLSTAEELDGAYGSVDGVPTAVEEADAWVERYQSKYDRTPDFFTAAYYDAVYMLKDWIEENGTEPDALREAILATEGWEGVTNTYSFQPDGESVFDAAIIQYEGAEPTILETVEISPEDA